jgi:hypothetical protein
MRTTRDIRFKSKQAGGAGFRLIYDLSKKDILVGQRIEQFFLLNRLNYYCLGIQKEIKNYYE